MSQTFDPPPPPPAAHPDSGLWAPDDAASRPPRRLWPIAAGVATLALLGVTLPVLLHGGGTTRPPAAGSGPAGGIGNVDFVTYRDDVAGFTIQHPRLWAELHSEIPDVRLVLATGTASDSVSVRFLQLENPVLGPGLPDVKSVTDGIFQTIITGLKERNLKILDQKAITLNGMVGYYYLYTFVDAGGRQGVHTHYFLYQGKRLYQLVFQALPSDDLGRYSNLFDKVAATFRTDPEGGR